MQSIGNYPAHIKRQKRTHRPAPVQHYAHYHDVSGVATLITLIPGDYAFQPAQGQDAWLVSYKDPALVLLGRCDLADAQAAADGDIVHKASGMPPTVLTVLAAVQALTDQARQAAQAHQTAGDAWEADNLAVISTDLQRLVNRCHAALEA